MKTTAIQEHEKLSREDVVFALEMMISCLVCPPSRAVADQTESIRQDE